MISKTKVFLIIFFPSLLTLALSLALIHDKNNSLSSSQFSKMMKSQWQLIALMLDGGRTIEKIDFHKSDPLRVTLLGHDGQVIFDSAVHGPFEQHREREEVRSALAGQPMFITRYSRSTKEGDVYFAQKLSDGRVLRLSYPAQYYKQQQTALFRGSSSGLTILCALLLLFSIIAASYMGRRKAALKRAVREAQQGGSELPCFNNPDLDSVLYCLSKSNRELQIAHNENIKMGQRLNYVLDNIDEGVLLLEGEQIAYHNKKAEQILNYKLPQDIKKVNKVNLIGLFEKFRREQAMTMEEINVDSKIIAVNLSSSGSKRLAILYDISDREKYSGYKSNLVGNISHELKTPLTMIMGAAETILKDQQMPKEYLDKFLNNIYKNAERINNILNDLIFLHRLENAKSMETGECNLNGILTEVQELIEPGDKEVIYQCDTGTVRIHSAHLMSILTNLIYNAIQYSNGVKIFVNISHSSNIVEIKVMDEGPVIPTEDRARVFERFYSLSQSRHREKSGSGLGLSIVKHIARLYRGQVELKKNDMGGNTFLIRLVEQ